jgi:ferredoxin-NADP reductase
MRSAPIGWQTATVAAIEPRTPTVKSFFFELPQRFAFTAGQHVDVRLTADDGYQAQRSYSIASAPESSRLLELAIERLDDGEVSPFFHDVARIGDAIELRGPIGGHFVWSVDDGGPVLLVGGGSGLVPLACMMRHRATRGSRIPIALVVSARTHADLIFGDELRTLASAPGGFAFLPTLTRDARAASDVRTGRIGVELMREALEALPATPRTEFVCGANPFVEHVSGLLLALDIPAASIRTERYGG